MNLSTTTKDLAKVKSKAEKEAIKEVSCHCEHRGYDSFRVGCYNFVVKDYIPAAHICQGLFWIFF